MILEQNTILIISNEPWSEVWYSKHNWAWELSRQNNVFFINPPSKWKFSNIFFNKIKSITISKQLKVLNYYNFLPGNENREWTYNLNNSIVSKRLRKYFIKHQKTGIIFWSFDPYRLIDPALLDCKLSIFHIADKYVNKSFTQLINNSDFILCVSPEFALIHEVCNKPHLILNHAIPDDFFYLDPVSDLPSVVFESTTLLFVGVIDFRLDFRLIEYWATQFSEYQFVFVGPINDSDLDFTGKKLFIEKQYKNVITTGPVPFRQLKKYIANAAVTIAPMKISVHGNVINHQKLLQYLAWGKPVICPHFSDYAENHTLFFEYYNPESSADAIKIALSEPENSPIKKERINFAKQFSFSRQFKRIEELISKNAHLIRNS